MNDASARRRYLPALTARQIALLPDKAWAPVILTTGAIEQHGPHLPVAVDALMGQVWLERALARLSPDLPCYVAPPITIGKSNEHIGFPGTLSVSKETLRELLLALARQLHAWGFRQLAVLNTHGGNLAVMAYTLREIQATLGLHCSFLAPPFPLEVPEQEASAGFHANTAETSWLLAVAPQWVRMEEARREYGSAPENAPDVRPERAPATFAWITTDLSRSGILGDATAASAEKGAVWIERGADLYAAAIAGLAERARRACGGA